jgi:hypothetical protein
VVFSSKAYLEKDWTRHELRAIQANQLSGAKSNLLEIRLDDNISLPGIPRTVGFLSASKTSRLNLALYVLSKIRSPRHDGATALKPIPPELAPLCGSKLCLITQVMVDTQPNLELEVAALGVAPSKHNGIDAAIEVDKVTGQIAPGSLQYTAGVYTLIFNHDDYPPSIYRFKQVGASKASKSRDNIFIGLYSDVTTDPEYQIMTSRCVAFRYTEFEPGTERYISKGEAFEALIPILKNEIALDWGWLHSDHWQNADLPHLIVARDALRKC